MVKGEVEKNQKFKDYENAENQMKPNSFSASNT
jgi:hypothetical protein